MNDSRRRCENHWTTPWVQPVGGVRIGAHESMWCLPAIYKDAIGARVGQASSDRRMAMR